MIVNLTEKKLHKKVFYLRTILFGVYTTVFLSEHNCIENRVTKRKRGEGGGDPLFSPKHNCS